MRQASATALHGPWPPPHLRSHRVLARCEVEGAPALVLGSSQAATTVDPQAAAAAGVEVVRRHSGGGAVLVAPGAQAWVEAWIPRADPLWDGDVVRGALWLGRAWATALASLGASGPVVHEDRLVATAWSATMCFAGVGPGEVLVGGRKVTGLAQRRTREGARFTTSAPVHLRPAALVGLLALGGPVERAEATAELAAGATDLRTVLAISGLPSDDAALARAVAGAVITAASSTAHHHIG